MIILVVVVLNTLLFQPLSSEISFMEAITPVHLKYPKQIVSHMLRARSCVLESDLDIEGGMGWGTDQVCAAFYLLQCITSLDQIYFQIAMCSYPQRRRYAHHHHQHHHHFYYYRRKQAV